MGSKSDVGAGSPEIGQRVSEKTVGETKKTDGETRRMEISTKISSPSDTG